MLTMTDARLETLLCRFRAVEPPPNVARLLSATKIRLEWRLEAPPMLPVSPGRLMAPNQIALCTHPIPPASLDGVSNVPLGRPVT